MALSMCAFPKGCAMTRKGLHSACMVFAIAAPERAELSYEKDYTLDSEYKLMVINLSASPFLPSLHSLIAFTSISWPL